MLNKTLNKINFEQNRDRIWALGLIAFGVLAVLLQVWIPIQITGGIFFLALMGGIIWLAANDETPTAAKVVSAPVAEYNRKAPSEVAQAWSNLPEQPDTNNSARPLLTPKQVEDVQDIIRKRHADRRVNDTI